MISALVKPKQLSEVLVNKDHAKKYICDYTYSRSNFIFLLLEIRHVMCHFHHFHGRRFYPTQMQSTF